MTLKRTIAGLTAATILAVGTAAPTYADPAPAIESQTPPPAYAGYNPPAIVDQPTTLAAKVAAGTVGDIRFAAEDGTVLGSAPISPDGTAELPHTFTKTGPHKLKAAVVTNGAVGDYSELYTVTVVRPGSSARIDVNGELDTTTLTAATVGLLASLVALIGSHSNIPAINATITHVQKSLGIWNEPLAGQVQRALPVVGTVVGGAGLIASIVELAKVLKAGEVEVTSSRVEA